MKARLRYMFLFCCLLPFIRIGFNCLFYHENSIEQDKVGKSTLSSSTITVPDGLISYLSTNLNAEDQSPSFSIWKRIDFRPLQNYMNLGYSHRNSLEFAANCRMSNCFDLSRCKLGDRLRIHIYPDIENAPRNSRVVSPTYHKLLQIVKESPYYEVDAEKACLFITSYDTLDRDPLSPDFQKNLPHALPLHGGRNHLVFNLYSGSWPDYNELDFGQFNPGQAILVKASISNAYFRPGFDISLPLFSKSHPAKGVTSPVSSNNPAPLPLTTAQVLITSMASQNVTKHENRHLLVFKGKRYIYGRGSETRNMLHHLHNDQDVLMATTCKHGKRWREWKDERCAQDNLDFENYSYEEMMNNSTFCLVPRGRRLGSFRFLEALSAGCIPVILSNDWVLPFEEVIDWDQAVVRGDERILLQLPDLLRTFHWKKIALMRAACLRLYQSYFASLEQIVSTTIKILNQRIQLQNSVASFIWNLNLSPNALWYDHSYSVQLSDYPNHYVSSANTRGYTVLIYINKPISPNVIFKLIKAIHKSRFLKKILVLWALPVSPPVAFTKSKFFTSTYVPASIIVPKIKGINAKLYPYDEIETFCVLSLDPDSTLISEELDFSYKIWESFPQRIVGFTARDHYYDEGRSSWFYTSKWTNQFSIILLDSAFFHVYYAWIFTEHASKRHLRKLRIAQTTWPVSSASTLEPQSPGSSQDDSIDGVAGASICLDLYFNFLVSHINKESPIKVSQRKKTTNESTARIGFSGSGSAFTTSQRCFQTLFNDTFGYIPLVKSQARFDPLLFKDPVSQLRKKYRKLEQFT